MRAQALQMSEYVALALSIRGIIANEQGQREAAAAYFAQAEPVARRLGLPWPLIQLRHAQGVLDMRLGHLDKAERALREALAIAETAQWHVHAANVSIELSECLLAQGRLDEAAQVCASGLALAEQGRFDDLAALLRYVLSRVRHAQGDTRTARELAQAALEQVRRSGHYRLEEIAVWAEEIASGA